MKQIALDIGLHTGPTLTNFFAGPNVAALQHLNLWASSPTRSPVPTYLWGGSSSGKSHLLKAVAQRAAMQYLSTLAVGDLLSSDRTVVRQELTRRVVVAI